MKKFFTVVSLLALLSVFAFSQSKKPVDYSQKIKEATPKALPQTPAVVMQTSDAQNNNLRGRVKSVVEERQGLTGVEQPIGRRMKAIADYDEKGRYLREVYFDYQGRPYSIAVYGFLDGARASLYGSIEYGGGLFTASTDGKEKNKVKPKPDPRYTFKYKFEYADGKISGMQVMLNTGEKGMRYVYIHTPNQREYLAYTEDNELNQKYIYTLDDKGNEIEQQSYNVNQTPAVVGSRYRYKYETFDKQGNWTSRIMSRVVSENETEELIAVEYRTITYYL